MEDDDGVLTRLQALLPMHSIRAISSCLAFRSPPVSRNAEGRVCECSDNGVDCARVPFGFGQ